MQSSNEGNNDFWCSLFMFLKKVRFGARRLLIGSEDMSTRVYYLPDVGLSILGVLLFADNRCQALDTSEEL